MKLKKNSRKEYSVSELLFQIEKDFDHGWICRMTPKDFFQKEKRFIDTHFYIKDDIKWVGQSTGDMEGTWVLYKSTAKAREEFRKLLISLGAEEFVPLRLYP